MTVQETCGECCQVNFLVPNESSSFTDFVQAYLNQHLYGGGSIVIDNETETAMSKMVVVWLVQQAPTSDYGMGHCLCHVHNRKHANYKASLLDDHLLPTT